MKKRKEITINDEYTMFYMAESFYFAAEAVAPLAYTPEKYKSGDAIAHLLTVYFINTAFAIELYLKFLVWIDNNKYLSGHNLYELFYDLKQSSRDSISDEYSNTGDSYPLEAYLKEAGDTFENFRYLFEDIENKFNSFQISRLIPILRKQIAIVKPEFIMEDNLPHLLK